MPEAKHRPKLMANPPATQRAFFFLVAGAPWRHVADEAPGGWSVIGLGCSKQLALSLRMLTRFARSFGVWGALSRWDSRVHAPQPPVPQKTKQPAQNPWSPVGTQPRTLRGAFPSPRACSSQVGALPAHAVVSGREGLEGADEGDVETARFIPRERLEHPCLPGPQGPSPQGPSVRGSTQRVDSDSLRKVLIAIP